MKRINEIEMWTYIVNEINNQPETGFHLYRGRLPTGKKITVTKVYGLLVDICYINEEEDKADIPVTLNFNGPVFNELMIRYKNEYVSIIRNANINELLN